jgi:hypothetical protein
MVVVKVIKLSLFTNFYGIILTFTFFCFYCCSFSNLISVSDSYKFMGWTHFLRIFILFSGTPFGGGLWGCVSPNPPGKSHPNPAPENFATSTCLIRDYAAALATPAKNNLVDSLPGLNPEKSPLFVEGYDST